MIAIIPCRAQAFDPENAICAPVPQEAPPETGHEISSLPLHSYHALFNARAKSQPSRVNL